MGGRGSASGGGAGGGANKSPAMFTVNMGGGVEITYRKGPREMVLDYEGVPMDNIPLKYSEVYNRLKKRAEEGQVQITKEYTNREVKNADDKLAESRRNKPDYELGVGVPWDNKEYRKRARSNRLINRVMKRRG